MGTITRTAKAGGGTNFNSGQSINPVEHNTDLDTAYSEFNGNIQNVNIKAAAGIAPSKLAHHGIRVTRTTNQSINDSTATAISWDTSRYNVGTTYTLGTTKITVATAGVYEIGAVIRWSSNATGERWTDLRVNGNMVARQTTPAVNGAATTQNASIQYHLAANDYVEVFVYQTSGGSLDVAPVANRYAPDLWIMLVGL